MIILNKISDFFKASDKVFIYFMGLPNFTKLLVLMTCFVLPVPFAVVFGHSELFTNTRLAAAFFKEYFILNNILLVIHITAAVPAIVFGPFMFVRSILKKRPDVHRKIGTYYIMGCLISAVTVLPLALANTPGTPASLGFSVMAVVWFCTSYLAYTAAINKDFTAHRRWVMRSYALTFAFVHVNFTYKLFPWYLTMPLDAIKVMQSMVSWQINLFFVEIYLAATTFKGRYVGLKQTVYNFTHWSPYDRFYLNYRRRLQPA